MTKDSYLNLIVGIIVVVAIAAVVIGLIRSKGSLTPPNGNQTAQEQLEATQAALPAKYKVAKGEDLWKISEKFYQSGYNWVDIAKENSLANPDKITEGMELTIPKVEPKVIEAATSISENEYTVVSGDSLWSIAVRAYGDGYKWVEIANANKLVDPDVIHKDNILKLPR
ncbi:LysM peptidoglycan-binding domain-containing protein [Candidatus Microgenomates bacterium]|nr:LysM peptidoglycan-binding domain-containing protein [Candidatus Microgenomates bacterium]